MKQISQKQYNLAIESELGFCVDCQEFTTNGVDPAEEDVCCTECGESNVFGVDQALDQGLVQIIEEDAEDFDAVADSQFDDFESYSESNDDDDDGPNFF